MKKYSRVYTALLSKIHIPSITYVMTMLFVGYTKLCYFVCQVKMKFNCTRTTRDSIQLEEELNKVSPRPDMQYTWEDKEKSDVVLSVIIPAYNAEKYVVAAVEPLCSVKIKYQLEIIIVNDGSKDNTDKMVKKLVAKYDNIVYISVENGGAAKARNKALDVATGKYLMFVDADDIVKTDVLEKLLDQIICAGADMIQASYESFNENGVFNKRIFSNKITTEKNEIMKATGFPWGKIYKRDLFNGVRFPSNVEYEDTIIHMIIYAKCQKTVFSDAVLYGYRDNVMGLTHSLGKTVKTVDSYWVVKGILACYPRLNLSVDEEMYRFLLQHLGVNTVSRIRHLPKEVQKNIFELSSNMIKSFHMKVTDDKLPDIYKSIEKAYLKGDFQAFMCCYKYAMWILNL